MINICWSGYWEVLIFTGVLMSALVYLWRLGALDWGHAPASYAMKKVLSRAVVADQTERNATNS
jgi:hypothetical protein